jgi:acetolactate synthase regulatory subunit
MSLTVHLRPDSAALAGVVSVLHARAVDVATVSYAVNQDAASLRIGVIASREKAERLAAQINRRVDVLDVWLADDPAE